MEQILLILIISITNLLCFYFGAKIGQKVINKEELKVRINPSQIIEERKSKKIQEKENEKMDTIMHNIDVYDGTSLGQKDIPKE